MAYSKEDVVWAYQYYLEQPPKNEALVTQHAASADLTRLLYLSQERLEAGLSPHSREEFCVWRRDRPKIVVLSSCQGPALARAIAAMSDVSVYGGAIILTKKPGYSEQLMGLIETADHILIADFSLYWGEFSEQNLRARFGAKVST